MHPAILCFKNSISSEDPHARLSNPYGIVHMLWLDPAEADRSIAVLVSLSCHELNPWMCSAYLHPLVVLVSF